jgi:RNA polymerase sigma-70 factor (ECF subfamily)
VTELDLVGRARHGDLDAFTALVGARVAAMTRTAAAILGDETEAHDAVQEALISIWRELPMLRELERFDAWAGRILVNACRHALKRRVRVRVREITLQPDGVDGSGLLAASGRVELLGQEDALTRAFERLDADQRAILVMHHLDDRRLAEIAAALGIPVGTAKSRLFKARRALRKALDRESR